MSALETTVRVNSENQTLILAGEPVPRRSLTESNPNDFAYGATGSPHPLTLVATPVDEPMLIAQSGFEDVSRALSTMPRNLIPSRGFADRGSAYIAVDAYARTQQLAIGSSRTSIIDTYA
jgi:hypothetical protein